MIRKLLTASLTAAAMMGSAYAADLPARAPPPPYVPPVPIFTWTGFYIGVNAGGAFRVRNHFDNNVFFPGVTTTPLLLLLANNNNNNNNGRFIGGGQVGVNWQINQFVLGIEADGQGIRGNHNNNNNFFNFGNIDDNTRFLGTVRGRAGIAFDRFLIYGTGGVAFGTGPRIDNFNPFLLGVSPFFFNNNNNRDNWLVGYAAGAGIEYAFGNEWAFFRNLSIKVEYLYTDIRRTDNNNNFFFNNNNDLFRERNHIVRAGLNYRFNWGGYGRPAPVVARY
jgi:outer membrane immunogenic protein